MKKKTIMKAPKLNSYPCRLGSQLQTNYTLRKGDILYNKGTRPIKSLDFGGQGKEEK